MPFKKYLAREMRLSPIPPAQVLQFFRAGYYYLDVLFNS
jgi:hypothetical protein